MFGKVRKSYSRLCEFLFGVVKSSWVWYCRVWQGNKIKMKNKIKSRDIVRKQYYIYCPKCNDEIKGNSASHVEVNLKFHLDKHKFEKKKKK